MEGNRSYGKRVLRSTEGPPLACYLQSTSLGMTICEPYRTELQPAPLGPAKLVQALRELQPGSFLEDCRGRRCLSVGNFSASPIQKEEPFFTHNVFFRHMMYCKPEMAATMLHSRQHHRMFSIYLFADVHMERTGTGRHLCANSTDTEVPILWGGTTFAIP